MRLNLFKGLIHGDATIPIEARDDIAKLIEPIRLLITFNHL